ncbi:hypothetical protein IZU87_15420 [Cobetia sp. MC34]|nr:hypothetical protein [Cobetia sp. MC34]
MRRDLKRCFAWYNTERPHQGLDDDIPDEATSNH